MAGYSINLPINAAGTFIYQGSTIALEDMVAWGLAKKSKKALRMSLAVCMGGRSFLLAIADNTQIKGGFLLLQPWWGPVHRTRVGAAQARAKCGPGVA